MEKAAFQPISMNYTGGRGLPDLGAMVRHVAYSADRLPSLFLDYRAVQVTDSTAHVTLARGLVPVAQNGTEGRRRRLSLHAAGLTVVGRRFVELRVYGMPGGDDRRRGFMALRDTLRLAGRGAGEPAVTRPDIVAVYGRDGADAPLYYVMSTDSTAAIEAGRMEGGAGQPVAGKGPAQVVMAWNGERMVVRQVVQLGLVGDIEYVGLAGKFLFLIVRCNWLACLKN